MKRILKITCFLGVMLLFTACPSETFCDKTNTSITLPDKIIISPDQKKFVVGQTLKLTINIPSKIEVSENRNKNIFEELGVFNSSKIMNISELLKGNNFEVLNGELIDSAVLLSYLEQDKSYKFECEIILKRKGNYRITGDFIHIFFIKNRKNCGFFDITTNIKNNNKNNSLYEFTVD